MNVLFAMLAHLLGWAALLGLIFILYGEPDLWDKWHAQAMAEGTDCKPATAFRNGAEAK